MKLSFLVRLLCAGLILPLAGCATNSYTIVEYVETDEDIALLKQHDAFLDQGQSDKANAALIEAAKNGNTIALTRLSGTGLDPEGNVLFDQSGVCIEEDGSSSPIRSLELLALQGNERAGFAYWDCLFKGPEDLDIRGGLEVMKNIYANGDDKLRAATGLFHYYLGRFMGVESLPYSHNVYYIAFRPDTLCGGCKVRSVDIPNLELLLVDVLKDSANNTHLRYGYTTMCIGLARMLEYKQMARKAMAWYSDCAAPLNGIGDEPYLKTIDEGLARLRNNPDTAM